MPSIFYVFLGGGLGSVCRYAVGQYVSTSDSSFPMATFVANILACLILGGLLGYQFKSDFDQNLALLFITGFCGGFSTFSTFSAESLKLFQGNQAGLALFYIGASMVVGMLCVYIGFKVQTSL